MVRPVRRVLLAGGSPVRVSAEALGSRPQPGGEILWVQAGNLKEARAELDGVRKLAKSPADIRDLDRLDALIAARSKGRLASRPGEKLLRAEGTAQALDCPVSGALLRVLVGDKEMVFDLPDPAAVEVLSGSADLHCGKLQTFHVIVEYAPPGVASKASAGIVRRVAF